MPNPADRRSVLLRLTEQGAAAVYQAPLPQREALDFVDWIRHRDAR